MKLVRSWICVLAAVTTLGAPLPAQCLEWDPTFFASGIDDWGLALAAFDDGTGPALYAGGAFTVAGNVSALGIAKCNGTSWSALGAPGSGVNGIVRSFVVFDDGSGPALYVGGDFTSAGGVSALNIARWSGTSWSAVGTPGSGMNDTVQALAVFDDGSGPALYAGGQFTTAGGVSAGHIAKWNGTSWSDIGGVGSGATDSVRSLAVFDDGAGPALYAGGSYGDAGGVLAIGIAKWNGTSWSAVGPAGCGVNNYLWCLGVFDDGSGPALYAGGTFTNMCGVHVDRVAKWDGTSWSALGALGSGPNSEVHAFAVFDDGSGPVLIVGGMFTSVGGVSALRLAEWDGTSWSPLGSPGNGIDGDIVFSLATLDDGSGPALYVGGRFDHAGAVPAVGVAKWNGTGWSPVGTAGAGTNGTVNSLEVFDDGSGSALFAGGAFTSAGAVSANCVAKWNGTSWSALGSGMDNSVSSLAVFDSGSGPVLYAGGTFMFADGISSRRVAKWNGASWTPLGPAGSGMNNSVTALATVDIGSGPALYAAGNFTTAGSASAMRIARWGGGGWSALGAPGSGITAPGYALAGFDDGSGPALFVGGAFTSAGGVSALRVAKWNGAGWSALGAPGSGMNGSVQDLAVFDDGSGPALYAGGNFTLADGVSAPYIAKWNGTSWSALGAPGSGTNASVNDLAVFDDGSGPALYAAGQFTLAGGVSALRIAKWNGTSWSALGAPGNGITGLPFSFPVVSVLAGFDDGSGPALYAGGDFSVVSMPTTVSMNIAAWGPCGASELLAFCFPGQGGVNTCPCNNPPAALGKGCNNFGAGPVDSCALTGSGLPSISADTFVLTSTGENNTSTTIFLQSPSSSSSGLVFGAGVRCINGTLRRLYTGSASGGTISRPGSNDPSIHVRSGALGDPLTAGVTRFYMSYYRDPNASAPCSNAASTFNCSNSGRLTWQP